jgi:predicted ATPase with chaperone activity
VRHVGGDFKSRAALQNANFDFPPRKSTVNLAPADERRQHDRRVHPLRQ